MIKKEFKSVFESVIIFGNIYEIENDKEKREVFNKFIERYFEEYIDEGKAYLEKYYDKTKMLKMSIEYITGKSRKG